MTAIKTRRGLPWTITEAKQLGKAPDSVIARRTKRTIKEIIAERERRRIRLATPPRRWAAREIRLLGHFNDREVARRLRRSYEVVRRQRINLGIPALRPMPKGKIWTRAEDKLLGTMPDQQLARILKRPVKGVEARRILQKIPKFAAKLHQWTTKEEALLGTMTDGELAARMGLTRLAVAHRRQRLGTPVRFAHRRLGRARKKRFLEPPATLKSPLDLTATLQSYASGDRSLEYRIIHGTNYTGDNAGCRESGKCGLSTAWTQMGRGGGC